MIVLVKRTLYFGILPFLLFYWRVLDAKRHTARAILLYDNHILLVREINRSYWSFPGGKIEKRELREELSLSIANAAYKLGEYISANKEDHQDKAHIFVFDVPSPTFVRRWELEDARWFSIDELPVLSPSVARRIEEFKRGDKGIVSSW